MNSDKIEREILSKIEAFAANHSNSFKLQMGVGTSPPPEPKVQTEKKVTTTMTSTTGTSPPPQSISTQTYEPVVFKEINKPDLSPNAMRRSQSISLGSSRVQVRPIFLHLFPITNQQMN